MTKAIIRYTSLIFLMAIMMAKAGDTTIVQTLTFDDIQKRRGTWKFPNNPDEYSKILMHWTLKCDPRTTRDRFACGEWDYIAYAFVYWPTGALDSNRKEQRLYTVGNASPDTINYTLEPMHDVYNYKRQRVENQSAENEVEHVFGEGDEDMPLMAPSARMQFMINKNELKDAGIESELKKLQLHANTGGIILNNLTIKIASTFSTNIDKFQDLKFTTLYQNDLEVSEEGWFSVWFTEPVEVKPLMSFIFEISYDTESAEETLLKASVVEDNVFSAKGPDKYVYFDGTNDYIDFGNIDELNGAEQLSIEMWVRLDQWEKWNRLISKGGKTGMETGNDQGTVYCMVRDEQNTYGNSGSVLRENVWTHLAMIFDGKGETNEDRLKLYVDGRETNLSFRGTIPNHTNTNMFPLTISDLAGNTTSLEGAVDEIRIWKTALSGETVNSWYDKTLDNSHPDYAELMAYYPVSSDEDFILKDESGSGFDGRFIGVPVKRKLAAGQLFKDVQSSTMRPNIKLFEGDYVNTLVEDDYQETLLRKNISIVKWKIADRIPVIEEITYAWPGGQEYEYDADGNAIDSNNVETDNVLYNETLEYYEAPYQVKDRLELGRFITPYGIGLDLGPDGFTWKYDVTDYAQYLTGDVELQAGNQQELIDLKFLFIEGTPPRKVLQVDRIWGQNRGYKYKNLDDDVDLAEKNVALHPEADEFKVVTRITGHGHHSDNGEYPHCCEWKDNTHYLMANGEDVASWKIFLYDECAWNPVFPQGGTWPGAREGWCPGDVVRDYNYEITGFIGDDDSVALDYDITPVPENNQGMGSGSYHIAMHLVQYDEPAFSTDVEIYDVVAPNSWPYYSRVNPVCSNPIIKVRNNGTEDITSMDFKYHVSGGPEQTYTWSGPTKMLIPHETVEVMLPIESSLFWIGDGTDKFHVEITGANGASDEYADNNMAVTDFEMPDLYEERIVLWYLTNLRPNDFTYQIEDMDGNVVFSKTLLSASTLYQDTLDLPSGCYVLKLHDRQNAGLSYWAYPQQGEGYFRIYSAGGELLRGFNPDFGAGITYAFSLGEINYVEDRNYQSLMSIWPSPADEQINVSVNYDMGSAVLQIIDLNGRVLIEQNVHIREGFRREIGLDGLATGSYFIRIFNSEFDLKDKFWKN